MRTRVWRRVWTKQYLERQQKAREEYFILRWQIEFIRIENDCKIELPFNPKTLAVHSPSEIIPYIKMANEHHKKYKKTKLYKMCRFILDGALIVTINAFIVIFCMLILTFAFWPLSAALFMFLYL